MGWIKFTVFLVMLALTLIVIYVPFGETKAVVDGVETMVPKQSGFLRGNFLVMFSLIAVLGIFWRNWR